MVAASVEAGAENLAAVVDVEGVIQSDAGTGQAQLMSGNGPAAAAEFRKILDHRGIVENFPTGALARLELARAYALQGDTNGAKAACRESFTVWKDADSDIPILKQAKAEYTKLPL